MAVDLEENVLEKCVKNETILPQCGLDMLNASLSRVPQECFRPRGQEVPQVTSLPGDVVDLQKLCEAMYSHKPEIKHCFVREDTGMHRFKPVFNCELTCCIWKNMVDGTLHKTTPIQGLRCGVRNQICVNGVCYDREDWIREPLPSGSVDIRPDVPRKKPF
uniref:Putative metalloprotease n=1 Tax=Ixodes ricinus TaxID=34613 RepID=A0A0K8RH50_IXORI